MNQWNGQRVGERIPQKAADEGGSAHDAIVSSFGSSFRNNGGLAAKSGKSKMPQGQKIVLSGLDEAKASNESRKTKAKAPNQAISKKHNSELATRISGARAAKLKQERLKNMRKKDLRSVTSRKNGLKGGRPSTNATEIAQKFLESQYSSKGGVFSLIFYKSEFYAFKEHCYEKLGNDDFRGELMEFVRNNCPGVTINANLLNNITLNLKNRAFCLIPTTAKIPCKRDGACLPGDILAFHNGYLSIDEALAAAKKGKLSKKLLKPHSPAVFNTFSRTFDFDPKAKCPRFDKYLEMTQPDEKAREHLLMLLGLCLIPDVRYEVAFFLVGPAGSGKTVFLNILESLVGKENTCCVPLSKFKEKFSLHPLTEKLVDIVGDMPTSGADFSLAAMEGAFKDVISGGIMPCERKFQDAYEARSTARLVFATNSMPRFSDKSNGVWARIRIIPFNVVVRGTKVENNHIDDDIIANELPGILNKALKALANLKTLRAFPELETGAKLKDEHRASCDPETEFLKDRFVLDKDSRIPVVDMQSMYNSHCKTNGINSKSSNRLADALRALFPSVEKNRIRRSDTGERIYMWEGIRENKSSATCEKLKASA